jgi:hypothetical protein
MADVQTTTEEVEILPGLPRVPFSFYEGDASNVPVADIGVVLGVLLRADDYLVVGDTDDAYSVFIRKGAKNTLGVSFNMMSFGDPPPEGPPMQRAQYRRCHLTVMNFENLRQLTLPFFIPEGLVYLHERSIWGTKSGDAVWNSPKEEVYPLISDFVMPIVEWVNIVKPIS